MSKTIFIIEEQHFGVWIPSEEIDRFFEYEHMAEDKIPDGRGDDFRVVEYTYKEATE